MRKLVLGLLGCLWLQGAGAETWRIGVIDDPVLAQPFQAVIDEALARSGIAASYQPMPLRRAELALRAGDLDADFARTQPFFDRAPEARKVGVPLRQVAYSAWGRDPCPARISLGELALQRVSYMRGTVAVESQLPATALVAAGDYRDMVRQVQQGMAAFALAPMVPGLEEAVSRAGLCQVPEPVFELAFYLAVHERHAARIPRLEAVLAEMARAGQIAKIWAEAEAAMRTWSAERVRRP